jgi:hypothetical protein
MSQHRRQGTTSAQLSLFIHLHTFAAAVPTCGYFIAFRLFGQWDKIILEGSRVRGIYNSYLPYMDKFQIFTKDAYHFGDHI